MTCPHCNYEHGYIDNEKGFIEGDKGNFYKSLLPMQRETWYEDEQRTLYACPNCGKTFINV